MNHERPQEGKNLLSLRKFENHQFTYELNRNTLNAIILFIRKKLHLSHVGLKRNVIKVSVLVLSHSSGVVVHKMRFARGVEPSMWFYFYF